MSRVYPLAGSLFLGLMGCGGPGAGANALPEIKDVAYLTDSTFGAEPEQLWQVDDPPTMSQDLVGYSVGGAPDGAIDDLVFLAFHRSPASVHEIRPYAPGVGALPAVPLDAHAICVPDGCIESRPVEFTLLDAEPVAGGGFAVAFLMWHDNHDWRRSYVGRFGADGSLAWSAPIEPYSRAEQRPMYADYHAGMQVIGLPDGGLVVAYDYAPDASMSTFSRYGVVFARYDADGGVTRGDHVPRSELEDAGHGLPGDREPFLKQLIALSDGGYAAVGYWQYYQWIACGTDAEPMAPDGTACANYWAQGMMARFSPDGSLSWTIETGDRFETEQSKLEDVLELPDGTLVATGLIGVNPFFELNPVVGGLIARVSGTGRIQSRTRVCPCQGWASRLAFRRPIARDDDAVDAIAKLGEEAYRLIRFDANDEIVALHTFPSDLNSVPWMNYEPTGAPLTLGDTWLSRDHGGLGLLRRLRLTP